MIVDAYARKDRRDLYQQVDLIEWLKLRTGKGKYDRPVIMPCSTADQFNGLLHFDFDDKYNDFTRVRVPITPYTVLLSRSAGNGWWTLLRVTCPVELYKDFWHEAATRFKIRCGLNVDLKNGESWRHVRFLPEREIAHYNPDAIPFKVVPQFKKETPKTPVSAQYGGDEIYRLVAAIEHSQKDITGDMRQWVAICSVFVQYPDGLDLFKVVSQYYQGYSDAEAEKVFRSAKRNGYTGHLAYLFKLAHKYGIHL